MDGIPPLAEGEVQVWWARLDAIAPAGASPRTMRMLSRRWRDTLLAACLRVPPDELAFAYGPWGKPAVWRPSGCRLRFSVAHSGHLLVVALALDHDLGVDVELREHAARLLPCERWVLTDDEAAWLPLAEPDAIDSLLRTWVRKEALLKALGEGLSRPLRSIDTLHPPAGWQIVDLPAPDDAFAALALPIGSWHIETHERGDIRPEVIR